MMKMGISYSRFRYFADRMLTQLEIKNYAIIQHVLIDFHKGLNIITGETGAGKSILLGALGLTLGSRADTKVLYHQEEKCVIEATYNITNYSLEGLFEDLDLDFLKTTLIRREISPSGKSRAFVNDTPVTLDVLKRLAQRLVNLTSQNETQQLNQENFQLEIVDATAENSERLIKYKKAFKKYQNLKKELSELEEANAKLQNDFDFFSFQLKEIEEAKLEEENLESIEEELSSLTNAETIKEKLFAVVSCLENEDSSVLQMLNAAYSEILEISKFKEEFKALADRINSSIIELEDLKNDAENFAENTESDEERILILSQQLNECNRLLRKHQLNNIEELMLLKEDLEVKTSSVHNNEVAIQKLQKEVQQAESEIQNLAMELSEKRKDAAKIVQEEIQNTMRKVGMPNAIFDLEFIPKETFTASGIDKVNFLFNANKGFAPQPLNKIASGGELSRVMLSIQALLAKKSALPTLIFDEIDTGISGEAAAKVAEVFRTISKKHQLISITHLPQIAAKAEKHFFIYKNDKQDKTETKIASLSEEQHVKAIARMLSGESISEESLSNAKILITT